jgi:hypothetical protein
VHMFCEKEAGTVIRTYCQELCTCVPVYLCIADPVSVLVWSRLVHVFCEKEVGTVIRTYCPELCTCVPVFS